MRNQTLHFTDTPIRCTAYVIISIIAKNCLCLSVKLQAYRFLRCVYNITIKYILYSISYTLYSIIYFILYFKQHFEVRS